MVKEEPPTGGETLKTLGSQGLGDLRSRVDQPILGDEILSSLAPKLRNV